MSYYYFLPKPTDEIDSSIVVTDLVANSRGYVHKKVSFQLPVYQFDFTLKVWRLRKMPPKNSELHWQISSTDLDLEPGQIAVVVPIELNAVAPKTTGRLPRPVSRKVDGSPVASRCSLRLHWRGVSSSYQSEYPENMADRHDGQIVSVGFGGNTNNASTESLFCAVNVSRDTSADSATYRIVAFDSLGLAIEGTEQRAYRNACHTIVSRTGESNCGFGFAGIGALFIPLYVSTSASTATRQMSFEHTHPPSTMFWREIAREYCMPKFRQSWDGTSNQ